MPFPKPQDFYLGLAHLPHLAQDIIKLRLKKIHNVQF
jgi:hypothetical protein